MNYVVKKKQTRTHYRVRWVELDGPKQKDGFTTRLAAEEWRDKHVIGEGFTGAKIESYQVRKVRDAWL